MAKSKSYLRSYLKSHNTADNSLDYFIEVDSQQQLMSIHCSGILTFEGATLIIQDVLKYQPSDTNYNRLYDFTEIQIDFGISEYENILSESKKAFGSIGNPYKAAFVSPDPFTLQLISIFKVLSHKHIFQEIRYFKTSIQAIGWLTKDELNS